MLNQLLPRQINNTYRGQRIALWLFALVAFVRISQSIVSIFNGYYVLPSADGIPLDTYTPAAAQTAVALFALNAFSRLIISLLCVLVLVRYRSAISFMFVLLALEYSIKQLILQFIPLVMTGTPPGVYVNLILLALVLVGLALSLWSRSNLRSSQTLGSANS